MYTFGVFSYTLFIKEAQLRNEFEQLYNEEKQKNVRLMEEIDQLKFKKNEFEQLYNKEKEINVRLTEERQNINHLQKMASSTRGEDGVSAICNMQFITVLQDVS